MKERIARYLPHIRFLLIYTLLFLVAARFILYFLPFLIALGIAVVMKPIYDFMKKRLSFKPSFSATVITLFLFSVMLSLAGFLIYLITSELIRLTEENYELLSGSLESFVSFERIYDTLMSGKTIPLVSGFAAGVIRTVPLAITFLIITFALTVYFLNHLGAIKNVVLSRFQGERKEKLALVFHNAYSVVRKFFRSYMILYLITFVEAAFIFYLTQTPYPLVFALITAIADLLPVLGPGAVYIPMAAVNFLKGNWLAGVTLLVFYLICVIIRQITEPKIVSDTVKLSPLLVLSAIYFSIVSMNIWLLFYIILLALIVKILKMSKVM